MADQLKNAENFATALAEVEILLNESDNAAPDKPNANDHKVAVMNKAALLLLTGKFEAFLEEATEDFICAINCIGAKRKHVPVRLLAEHSIKSVREAEQKFNAGKLGAIQEMFVALGRLWTDIAPCNNLDVSCKFTYGKHGENEVIRLFKRIGFDDIFQSVTIPDDTGEIYEGSVNRTLDVRGMVNSLTGIRNNIIHQDETPNLTTVSLRKQSASLQRFATALMTELQAVVDNVEQKQGRVG